ncbi:hypothetical protein OVA07_00275 [Novosphingobium sp. SL115]|uniref:hypothetical protein n=1 Tax=Novosphingobium sp. SL115 TaxID=2995150 RepID=UPI0022750AE4|nr:hypothetical protein [Novosphingobium sp. SL115]MCY1669459.1 hypothetical protein [Novosphingobium sp. SL115]
MDKNSNLLPEVIVKLTEVLEIIDRHDVPLAGIHVANAIAILNASLAHQSAPKMRKGGAIH